MKKIILTVIIALGVAISANAQGLGYGVELGGNFSGFNTKPENKDLKTKFGFQLGAFVDYSINDNLFVKANLMFITKGAKIEVLSTTTTYSPMYIMLPVVAGFGYSIGDIKPFVNAGFYCAYGIGGKHDFEIGKVKTSTDFFGNNTNKFDFGLRFGAGLELGGKYIVSFNYDLGLINLNSDKNTSDNISKKNYTMSLSLGYKF